MLCCLYILSSPFDVGAIYYFYSIFRCLCSDSPIVHILFWFCTVVLFLLLSKTFDVCKYENVDLLENGEKWALIAKISAQRTAKVAFLCQDYFILALSYYTFLLRYMVIEIVTKFCTRNLRSNSLAALLFQICSALWISSTCMLSDEIDRKFNKLLLYFHLVGDWFIPTRAKS